MFLTVISRLLQVQKDGSDDLGIFHGLGSIWEQTRMALSCR